MKAPLIILIALTLVFTPALAAETERFSSKESAVGIAEAFLVSIYGEQVLKQRPFIANSDGNYWSVVGSFHCPKGALCVGGVAQIKFSKKDGQISSVGHTK